MEDLRQIYDRLRSLSSGTTMDLVRQAQTEEERRFWAYVLNMNLQRNQKIAIENNWF